MNFGSLRGRFERAREWIGRNGGQGGTTTTIGPAAPRVPETPESAALRRVMVMALFGAGVVCTFGSSALVYVIWRGGWTPDTQAQRLEILGWSLLAWHAGVLAVIIAFAIGGPVGRLKVGAGLASFEADAAGSGVAITTTTEVTPTTAPAPPQDTPPPSPGTVATPNPSQPQEAPRTAPAAPVSQPVDEEMEFEPEPVALKSTTYPLPGFTSKYGD